MRNGEAVQVVAPSATLALPVIDLSALDESRREGEAHRLAGAEAKRTFQLSVGPLLRATVIRLGPERHSVFVTMHHIIADGWSVGVFLRETLVLYDAFTLGETSPFPELAIQYADFAVWQREWLRDGILEEQLGYWREQLAELPSFSLHTDRPRPAEQSFRGATISFDLSSELTGSVKELSGRSDATLFMTLMAGFQALMARYTGKEDIVVGSGIANRNRVEVEELIGFFVNMLVLRGDLSGDPSFVELLGRIRETCLQAYAHQDLPFEKLVAELQPERDLSREPLVQVVFELQNYPLTTPDLRSDMKLTGFRVDAQMAKFDLSFYLWEESDRLTGFVEYNTDLFDASTIDRMIGHYRAVLEAVVADPAVRVSELPLLSESEQRRLVLEWGRKQETVSTLELPGDVEEGLL
jgi:hypothetical protein